MFQDKNIFIRVVVTTLIYFLTVPGYANTLDLPVIGSAKSNGMVGVGMAYENSEFAFVSNPAGLANVKKLFVGANIDLMLLKLKAPSNGDNTSGETSSVNPLFLFGMGYRLHKLISIGI